MSADPRESEPTGDDVATDDRPWKKLHEIVQADDAEGIGEFMGSLSAADAARTISHLDEEDQERVLTLVAPELAADLIEQLPERQAADLIEQIRPTEAAQIVDHLPSDEQADILNEMEQDDAEAVLSCLPPKTAADIRALKEYPPHVAGGLMITEFLSYREQQRVGEILDDLRRNAERYRNFDVQYAYITGANGRLRGVLPFRQVLLAAESKRAGDIMSATSLTTVSAETSLDELADMMDHYRYYGLPVLDEDGRLLGVVRRTDIREAEGDRAEQDHLKSQGIVAGEELRSMPLALRSRRRLSWLSINIVLNVAAASVIAAFESTLSAVIALAVFLPIISDMSGCSGSQAVAVSMRELTLGLVKPVDLVHVWLKEVGVGLVNGVVLGLLIGVVAFLWKGNAWLGLVVGAALGVNTVIAVSIGGLVPLVLKRLGMDPALASGPVLTTITDLCGFSLVLGFATLALANLTG